MASSSRPSGPAGWSVAKDLLNLSVSQIKSITGNVTDGLRAEEDELRSLIIDAISGKVSVDCFKGLNAFAKVVSYDGFNPQTIILEMARMAKADPSTDNSTYTFEADGVRYELPRKCDLARDVQMFVTLFLVRGNNLFKILQTTGKDAKVAISAKISAYKIKSDNDSEAAARKRKERVVLASKDITLSRIAASFPHITLAVAKSASIPGKADLLAISGQYRLNTPEGSRASMPHILQHGLLPALLKKSMPSEQSSLRNFCYMFNLEQTITLQTPSLKKSIINEPLSVQCENSVRFVDAAINGPMSSDEDRRSILEGLVGQDKEAFDSWVEAGNAAWIRSLTAATYSGLINDLRRLAEASQSEATA